MALFTHDNQPYGRITFDIDRAVEVSVLLKEKGIERDAYGSNQYLFNRAMKGWIEVSGIVIKGGITSRLFHATSTRSLVGQRYTVQVPPEAFVKREYVSVAM